MSATSWGEATTPSTFAAWARRASRWTFGATSGSSPSAQAVRVVAGQDRHRQQPLAQGGQRAHRGLHHGLAAQRVHGQERDAEPAGRAHRARDRVGDVVVLEVEEDLLAAGGQLADEARPGRGEELAADLEHAHTARERVHEGAGVGLAGHVERHDHALPRLHPPVSGGASGATAPGICSVPTTSESRPRPWRCT
jgi:hypothetical protein